MFLLTFYSALDKYYYRLKNPKVVAVAMFFICYIVERILDMILKF